MEVKISQSYNRFYQYIDFIQKINISNNQIVYIPEETKQYKVYIGKGNNFKIIKDAFKKRFK